MKRLLALLLLCIAPVAYGQVDYSTAINVNEVVKDPALNACIPGAPTCGAWMEGGGWVTGEFLNGSYVFSYQPSILFQDIDLSPFKTNATQFFYSFDLNNSCRNSIGGYCENEFGPIDTFRAKAYAYNIDNVLIGEATFLDGPVSTAYCEGGLCYPQWQRFGFFTSFESQTELSRIRIEFSAYDIGYWGGYYGPQIDNISASIRYVNDQSWTRLAGEYEQFTLAEDSVVRYGAYGTYAALFLQAGTYDCGNGLFGDPIGGVVKSCEIVQPPPTTVDCTLNPADPSCIIDSLVDTGVVDPVDQAIADATTTDTTSVADSGSDDGSSDGTDAVEEEEEEVLVAEETPTEQTNLETILQDDSEEEDTPVVAEATTETVSEKTSEPAATVSVAAIVEDSKASELADSISKNVLEGALSIAADATSAASATTATTESSSSSTKTTTTSSSSIVAQESTSSEFKTEETKQESSESSSIDALDILETGRQIGIAALATTLSDTASSATDSVSQAESIASDSAESSVTVVAIADIRIESVIATDTIIETDTNNSSTETTTVSEETNNSFVVAETQTTTVNQIDSFADIMQLDIKPDTGEVKNDDFDLVQQIVAASQEQKQEETNNSGFSEEEKVTIANDPALANAFNVSPNITNLEMAGVLGGKQEEKSDAEKRADEVVAANAKEQEEINKNYMDADQSGIVAAMGSDTDVSAYRTAMIRDNNNWYKPEDIYKGIIIKDNVRGSYFLEKGNTDTYKKMVEEQYK